MSDIVCCTGIKHQAAEVVSWPSRKGTDKPPLEENVPVLAVSLETFMQERKPSQQDQDINVTNEQKADAFVPFLPHVAVLADQVQQLKTDNPDLAEFLKQQIRDK